MEHWSPGPNFSGPKFPWQISSICSPFLRENGAIVCKVTGSRRNSEDLPQEVPCTLKFQGKSKDIDKVKKLPEPQSWAQHGGIILSTQDKANITRGEKLNDKHVNFAQQLVKAEFTS